MVYEGLTVLDFVGAFDALTRLKTMKFREDVSWDIAAMSPQVTEPTGLTILPTVVGATLSGYDLLVVPGGFGSRKLMTDQFFLGWLQTAADCPLKTSVCTGSLLLGAAGFLKGLRATTHPGAYDLLKPFCREVTDERVVDEGHIVTARGVSSAIDLGLHLCERLAGVEARKAIAKQMDYRFE